MSPQSFFTRRDASGVAGWGSAIMQKYPAIDQLANSVFNHIEIPHEFGD